MNGEAPMAVVSRATPLSPFQCRDMASLAMDADPTENKAGLAAVIGGNVRKLRKRLGLSLETLARRSRVSRAMLSQIELGRSTPTIAVLWKIAYAMETPVSAFLNEDREESVRVLPAAGAKWRFSGDGRFGSRALFPFEKPRRVEFYELRLKSRGMEIADSHPVGTVENLVVHCGRVEIAIGENRYALTAGDAIQFMADVAHNYCNVGSTEAVLYLVVTYGADHRLPF